MKYRIAEKRNQYARCLWLADNLGRVKRSYLAFYFNRHPHDFTLVKHLCKQQGYNPYYVQSVKKDVKMNYRHPDFSQEKCNIVIEEIENTYFTPYIRLKKQHLNIGVNLSHFYRLDRDYDFVKLPNNKYIGTLRK